MLWIMRAPFVTGNRELNIFLQISESILEAIQKTHPLACSSKTTLDTKFVLVMVLWKNHTITRGYLETQGRVDVVA